MPRSNIASIFIFSILFILDNVLAVTLDNLLQLPEESVKMHPDTVLVLWGTRHGNRNPEDFLPNTTRTFGQEGVMELTVFGKRQSLGLGRELRKFVGDNFVQENYLANEAKYYSSSANRCQMTLQAALAGFYTPSAWGEWDQKEFDNWGPVPYTIDDPLLRMYAEEGCKASDEGWQPITDDTLPELWELRQQKQEILDYISNNTGWEPKISVAADVADNIIQFDLFNETLPQWIAKPYGSMQDLDMKTELLSFAEAHQIACAEYEPCRNMMGGLWEDHILKSIHSAMDGKGPKVIGYASHTEVTLSVMKLLGYAKDELTTSAGFVIEFRVKPYPSVRLLNHDPNPIDDHIIYFADLIAELNNERDGDGFIPLEVLERQVNKTRFSDWKEECELPDPTNQSLSSDSKVSTPKFSFSRIFYFLSLLLLVL